jgi:hypothetical protein
MEVERPVGEEVADKPVAPDLASQAGGVGGEERLGAGAVQRVATLVALLRVLLGGRAIARVLVDDRGHDDPIDPVTSCRGRHGVGDAPAGLDRQLERQPHERHVAHPHDLDRQHPGKARQREHQALQGAAQHPLAALWSVGAPARHAGPERRHPVDHRGLVLERARHQRGAHRRAPGQRHVADRR